ncbi:MAG: TatD family hydrolase [Ardenticatenaceae bacterium]|nr:TatD family hydrolase [Ardenticatenaceae bacterium]
MLIDTHCHLDFEWFDEDRAAMIARAVAAGVTRMIVPAIDLAGCTAVLRLGELYDEVYTAVGIHPNATADWQDSWLDSLRQWAQPEKVVAIGEIGLDYYRDRSPKDVQHHALRLQLELAAELNLPVILHNRESNEDIIRLLRESPLAGRERPGVLHSFAADWATAQAALDMGFYLGFTGPVTYKKADDLRRIVAQVPLDRLLVETDAPFLAPQQYRGKRNEPAYVRFVAERIAAIHGLETAELARITTQNALQLFSKIPHAH